MGQCGTALHLDRQLLVSMYRDNMDETHSCGYLLVN